MAYRFFQSVIVQLKDATDREIGVVDESGLVLASSELSLIGSALGVNEAEFNGVSDGEIVPSGNRVFKKVSGRDSRYAFRVYVGGTDQVARSLCGMAAVAVSEAIIRYEEKYDKSTLIKNIITDNILPSETYTLARELSFTEETSRGVFLIRSPERKEGLFEAVQSAFPDKYRDFVLSMSETDVVVVKELSANNESKEMQAAVTAIEQALPKNANVTIGIGAPARSIRELADRYKETQMAIEIGRVFNPEKTVLDYEGLGLGRLIYQLPTTLCDMFLSEVFKKNPIDSLDKETLAIIDKFFENNLNISETSRKLFVHRNTLVYRLGKIKKLTDLDLREFDQAIVFKVALMVKKYLDAKKA